MRQTALACVLALVVTAPALAQDWTEYRSVRDGFEVNFLGQPRVTETTWKSQAGFNLPSRVYSVERGRERYSVTIADYSESSISRKLRYQRAIRRRCHLSEASA